MAARAAAKIEVVKALGVVPEDMSQCSSPRRLLGLAYFVFFPFIGLAMLAWMGEARRLSDAANWA